MKRLTILLSLLFAICGYAQTGINGTATIKGTAAILGGGGGGGPTVTLVSSTTCGGNFTNSFTCAANQNVPVGARLVAVLYSNVSMATLTPAISDAAGNTYASCSQNNLGEGWAFCDSVVTTQLNSGQNVTISIPGSGGSNGAGAYLFALSSHTGASGTDVTLGAANSFSATASTTTASTLTATDFVIACGSVSNSTTFGAFTSSYTMTGINNTTPLNGYNFLTACGWKTQVSGATASVSSSLGASANWTMSVLPYKQ